MLHKDEYDRAIKLVSGLIEFRHVDHGCPLGSVDSDHEIIAIVDGLIHRVLSKLTDQAAGD